MYFVYHAIFEKKVSIRQSWLCNKHRNSPNVYVLFNCYNQNLGWELKIFLKEKAVSMKSMHDFEDSVSDKVAYSVNSSLLGVYIECFE